MTDALNAHAMTRHDPTWRLRARITQINKALIGCITHPNGMSRLLAEQLEMDKRILKTEIKRRRAEAKQANCLHEWKHTDATVHNRLVTSTWCRKCFFVPAEAAARACDQQSA